MEERSNMTQNKSNQSSVRQESMQEFEQVEKKTRFEKIQEIKRTDTRSLSPSPLSKNYRKNLEQKRVNLQYLLSSRALRRVDAGL